MSSRISRNDEQDSFDLLLDTVSNVFGGVMFLTLLAALLVLSRGATQTEEPKNEESVVQKSTTMVDAKIRQAAIAIHIQQKMKNRLDPDGSLAGQVAELTSLQETLTLAKRHRKREDQKLKEQQDALEDQKAAQSDLDGQIRELQAQLEDEFKSTNRVRNQSERNVEFRALSRSTTGEAVFLLRYGRWYALQSFRHPNRVNRDDLFVIKDQGSFIRVTPKPNRGNIVNQRSLDELKTALKRSYKPNEFHVVIAVWDDSFSEFNQMKDAVKAAGFQYRTLPCDSSSRLTNQAAVDAFVQ